MTEEEKRLCEAYIPNPPDDTLDDFEYYVKDINDKVYKVHIGEFNCYHDKIRYAVYTDGGKHIKSGSNELGDYTMSNMYDNKQDCKNDTHWAYDGWEELRKKQLSGL